MPPNGLITHQITLRQGLSILRISELSEISVSLDSGRIIRKLVCGLTSTALWPLPSLHCAWERTEPQDPLAQSTVPRESRSIPPTVQVLPRRPEKQQDLGKAAERVAFAFFTRDVFSTNEGLERSELNYRKET